MRGRNFIHIVVGALLVPVVACSDDAETLAPDPSVPTSSASSAAGGNGSGGSSSVSTSGSGGGENSNQAGFVSGSRLRARYLEGTDGSKEFLGFFDDDKQVACTFQPVYTGGFYAGERYCLPDMAIPQTGASAFYSDMACTQRVASFLDCPESGIQSPTPPPYVSVRGGCMVMEVRPVLGPAPAAYYKNTSNVCVAISNQNKWLLGAAVPFTDFVKGTEKIE